MRVQSSMQTGLFLVLLTSCGSTSCSTGDYECDDNGAEHYEGTFEVPVNGEGPCGVTLSRGSNIISYSIAGTACTRTAGPPAGDGDDSCVYDVTDKGEIVFILAMGSTEEAFLGGPDFELQVFCGAPVSDTHASFTTFECRGEK